MSGGIVALIKPPANITFPLASRLAVCQPRSTGKFAALVHVLLAGLYRSVLCNAQDIPGVQRLNPPATMTSPFRRRVAVCDARSWLILAALDQLSVAGS